MVWVPAEQAGLAGLPATVLLQECGSFLVEVWVWVTAWGVARAGRHRGQQQDVVRAAVWLSKQDWQGCQQQHCCEDAALVWLGCGCVLLPGLWRGQGRHGGQQQDVVRAAVRPSKQGRQGCQQQRCCKEAAHDDNLWLRCGCEVLPGVW